MHGNGNGVIKICFYLKNKNYRCSKANDAKKKLKSQIKSNSLYLRGSHTYTPSLCVFYEQDFILEVSSSSCYFIFRSNLIICSKIYKSLSQSKLTVCLLNGNLNLSNWHIGIWDCYTWKYVS